MAESRNYEFLQPLVTGWLGKIEQSRLHKKPFDDVAQQCDAFFSSTTGFMWDPQFQRRYMRGKLSPKFKMTMNKAFELVALFGPVLYWRNPQRVIKPRQMLQLEPELFGVDQQAMQQLQQFQQMQQQQPGPPPPPQVQQQMMELQMAQQMFQQAMQEQQQRASVDRARAKLMELYLNYTPWEQPGGGLASHAERAITEALVKGRGCLWSQPYSMPGSRRVLTGSFFDSVDNLFLDPDADSPDFRDGCTWIAKRECKPTWEVERDFNLPKGSLEGRGQHESAESQGERLGDDMHKLRRKQGQTYDLITYYKIWSRGGVGARLTGVNTGLKDAFDKVVGDYAYIVVAPNVPYPLNAPSEVVRKASDDEVSNLFQWPFPTWTDDRWPVAFLDFYPKPGSAWPIAPMAPGLGELVFINVMVSHLANRIWSSSRDLIAVLKSAAAEVKSAIEDGKDQQVIEISEVHSDIRQIIQFLQQPQTNFDVWQILDRMMEIFDKRVGLSELLYGLNAGGTQSRTATDASAKREMVSVRPDHMASKVEQWMIDAANLEKFAARWFVEARDLQGLFGPAEQFLWTRYVNDEDPEIVVREMKATVAAGSTRKPNKDRDTHNVNTIAPSLVPELSKHADITGDTNPLNRFFTLYGEAIDMDMSGLQMGPRTPAPPPPEVQQQMQQQAEMENAKLQAEVEVKRIEAQLKQIEMQIKQLEVQGEGQELQQKERQAQMELQFDQAEHQQEMQQKREEMMLDLELKRAEMQFKLAQARQQAALDQQIAQQQGALQLATAEAQAEQKIKAAKAMPKPAAGKNGQKTGSAA